MEENLRFKANIDDIKEGINFLNDKKIVAIRKNGKIRAITNRCQHMNGQFLKEEGHDCVKCPFHNWTLNLATLEYSNPEGLKHKRELIVEYSGESVLFSENPLYSVKYWRESRKKQDLKQNEFGVTYYSHACFKVTAGESTFFADPWVYGPSFTKGWWLVHKTPENWRNDIAHSMGIYISHNHSDHMNIFSLKEIVKLNPEIPLFIPDFDGSDMEVILERVGFRNIKVTPFNTWVEIAPETFIMILPDETGRHDSGMLFEYKGNRVLTTVDCGNCCSGELPGDIDLLMTSFAGGATGYPVCWEEIYNEKKIENFLKKNRRVMIDRVYSELGKTSARSYIPYAGYFTEAHPEDVRIRELNKKNSADDVVNAVNKEFPNVATHIPVSGDFFDLSLMENTGNEVQEFHDYESWEIEKFEKELKRERLSNEELREYFKNLDFKDNLTLHIVECEDDFTSKHREFYVDFSQKSGQLVHFDEFDRVDGNRYLRMQVKESSFNYVLREKLPWEELSIGFQCRFYRDPDIYNFTFWNHVQNFVLKK